MMSLCNFTAVLTALLPNLKPAAEMLAHEACMIEVGHSVCWVLRISLSGVNTASITHRAQLLALADTRSHSAALSQEADAASPVPAHPPPGSIGAVLRCAFLLITDVQSGYCSYRRHLAVLLCSHTLTLGFHTI